MLLALFTVAVVMLRVYVGLWMQLIVHELGHRLMRGLCHLPTTRIVLGDGPCAAHWGAWMFRAWPIRGQNEPPSYCLSASRWQKTWVLMAGAGLNGLVALALVGWMMRNGQLSLTLMWVAGFQLLGLLQLIPTRGPGGRASDGLFLIALWSGMRFCPPHPCGKNFVDPC